MLKILFSLLICVLGYCSNLDNVIKENLSEEGKVVSPISPESVPVTPAVNTPSKEPILYQKAYPVNIYNFPKYNEDVLLSKMQDSLLYVLVPVKNSLAYIEDLAFSIKKAIQELPEGCVVRLIFKTNNASFNEGLKNILKDTGISEESYDISNNPEPLHIDLVRQTLLDKMI